MTVLERLIKINARIIELALQRALSDKEQQEYDELVEIFQNLLEQT